MRQKLAPRMKHVDAPPVMMSTWIVRCYLGKDLQSTTACATEQDAFEAACDWRANGEECLAETEVIRQQRRLR
jgi:hypothetical protein